MSENMGDIDRLEGTLHNGRGKEENVKLRTVIGIAVDKLKFLVYQTNNGMIANIKEVEEEVNSIIADLSPFVFVSTK